MLVGHNKEKRYFQNLIKNDALSHAYLFTGPEMIGKRTFAFELAKTIFGDNFHDNPDFKLIAPRVEDGESKIYIEDIRDFKKTLSLKTYSGGKRVVIFDDAHCLTAEASNAVLKILEEPPVGSIIIMISSMPGLILPTISSRCEEVRFGGANEKEVNDFLLGKKVNKEDKAFLAKLAGGRIGLIEQLVSGNGIAEAKQAVNDLRKLLNSGIFERMSYAKKIHEKALRPSSGQGSYQPLIDYWLNWVSAHVRTSPKNEKIVKELLALHQIVSQPQFNHRLALENFLLNL